MELGHKISFFRSIRPHPDRQMAIIRQFFSILPVTNPNSGSSIPPAACVAIRTGFEKDERPMTISTRIALGISAAAVSLSLALAPAFAADDMKKDDGMMKKDDGMKK